jgi:hypothetical protein
MTTKSSISVKPRQRFQSTNLGMGYLTSSGKQQKEPKKDELS